MTSEITLPTGAGIHVLAGKYLVFVLQGETYGISVLQVREIIRLTTITTVPQMPAYVRGVINLRGKIIPVLDLCLRFGFADTHYTEQTCIIVAQVRLPGGKVAPMGLIVDGVEEAVNITVGDIEEAPDFGFTISAENIRGMAKLKGRVMTLLDIDRTLVE